MKGNSSKFWEIAVKGSTVSLHFGKIRTKGQEKTKEFADASAAEAAARKLVDEKLGKGYVETGAGAAAKAASPSSGHAGWGKRIDLVAPDDKEIPAEMALAATDPGADLERFEVRLSERGIDEADETLPSIGFLDALIDKGILKYKSTKGRRRSSNGSGSA